MFYKHLKTYDLFHSRKPLQTCRIGRIGILSNSVWFYRLPSGWSLGKWDQQPKKIWVIWPHMNLLSESPDLFHGATWHSHWANLDHSQDWLLWLQIWANEIQRSKGGANHRLQWGINHLQYPHLSPHHLFILVLRKLKIIIELGLIQRKPDVWALLLVRKWWFLRVSPVQNFPPILGHPPPSKLQVINRCLAVERGA
jgi:hypothetical protein